MKTEEISFLVAQGDYIKRLVESEDWKRYVQIPFIDNEIEKLRSEAFRPDFMKDFEAYKNHAAEYHAFTKFIAKFNNAINISKKLQKELSDE